MQQYREVKERHQDALVLFRVGDFFELFESDAETACRVLGLTLTSRDKAIPMAGFPHHALDAHVTRLVQGGYRVAVCDQVEDPASAQGLMRREVVRVLTPGTAMDDDLLDPRRPNHLVVVWPEGERVGLAWADLSTGLFQAADVDWLRLPDELGRIGPVECLHPEDASTRLLEVLRAVPGMLLLSRPAWNFEAATSRAALFHHFRVLTPAGFGFDERQPCLNSAGALLLYLQETCKANLAHLRRPKPYRPEGHLILDEVTRRSLELVRTMREGNREGSLLSFLDRTVTAMGARLFQESLLAPLTDRAAIEARLDAVAEFVEGHALRQDLRQRLDQVADLHRLSARAVAGRASPRDLAAVARTLRLLPELRGKLSAARAGLLRELERHLDSCQELSKLLDSALTEDPPAQLQEGGVIRKGHDAGLDGLRESARAGKEWLTRFQAEESARTGISSLKVVFTQTFGYCIEVSNSHARKVPGHYQRKQTLKNAERYVVPELKAQEEQVLAAEEQMRQREQELFVALRDKVGSQAGRLQRAGDVLARLDVLTALAELASVRGYCRPELCDEPLLEIKDGRHPVLDQSLPTGTVVPNDVLLGPDQGRLWLITGPNLSGKCVRGDTLVFTDRGLLPIKALMPEKAGVHEFIPLSCGVQGREGPARASHFYNGGQSPTLRVTTRLGFSLEGTPEHRLWVRHSDGREDWKRLADLDVGDRVVLEPNSDLWGSEVALKRDVPNLHGNTIQYKLPAALSPDLAYLLGVLLGDGTLTYENYVCFTNSDPWLVQEFQRIVREQFDCPVRVVGERGDYRICSKQIRMFLAANGLGYQNAVSKEIPGCIRCAPRDLVVAFLRGLFDTDGTVTRLGNVGYSTSSPRLAEEVQLLLLNLGIVASRRLKRTKSNPSYVLSINGEDALRYHERIGFGLPRKRARATLLSRAAPNPQVRPPPLDQSAQTGPGPNRVQAGQASGAEARQGDQLHFLHLHPQRAQYFLR